MTSTIDRPTTSGSPAHRSQLDLAAQQLRAIETFNHARQMAEQAAAAAGRSREMRMDAARSLEVVRRQHAALVARVDEQLRASGSVLRGAMSHRVVLAHRNAWFVDKVSRALHEHGLEIVASVENGADAVGAALAEQPDLLFVEDRIAMIPGEEVLREMRRYCPDTVLAAQVDGSHRVGVLLEAGANAVFTRQLPPTDVAGRLQELLAG